MSLSLPIRSLAASAACLHVAACAGSGTQLLQTASIDTLAKTSSYRSVVTSSPIEVYQRIATQSVKCWFSPTGSLVKTHIFHADAASPAAGGEVKIAIHRRSAVPKKPWGPKLYRIDLSGGASTVITFRNLGLTDATEAHVKSDTLRWAHGETTCSPAPPVHIALPTRRPAR